MNFLKTVSIIIYLAGVFNFASQSVKAQTGISNSRFLLIHEHNCWARGAAAPNTPNNDSEPYAFARSISKELSCKGDYGCSTKKSKVGMVSQIHLLQLSSEQVIYKVQEAFRAARDFNLPLMFHINTEYLFRGDVCFGPWMNHKMDESLVLINGQPRSNMVEYKSWTTPSSGYIINWGTPNWMPPRPNFASHDFRAVVKQRANIFLAALKKYSLFLKYGLYDDLFIGVDAGWETGISDDNADTMSPPQPKQPQGYGMLRSRGFSAANPPIDFEVEIGKGVIDYVQYEVDLYGYSLPARKVFTHFLSLKKTNPGYRRFPLHLLPQIKRAVYGISAGWGDNVGLDEFNTSVLQRSGNPEWAIAEAPPEIGLNYFEGLNTGGVRLPKYVVIYSWSAGNISSSTLNRIKSIFKNPMTR